MIDLEVLKKIIDIEYNDIVIASDTGYRKIRVYVIDGSVIDIWFSRKIEGRFSYHWERRYIDGSIYRHDNFPDPAWQQISTFPQHFHRGSEDSVEESLISSDPIQGIRDFMDFVREFIRA